ncbi:MAG: hemerythrin domain-containing protein, partial [Rhodoferax sp.]
HNMAVEELALFPAAVRELDDEDWHMIEHMTPAGEPDPLFDASVEMGFAELRRAIALEADCRCDT